MGTVMSLPDTPDFDSFPVTRRPVAAETIPDGVRVRWDDGLESRFHVFWLRENAADPETTHPVTREQQLQLLDIPASLQAAAVRIDDDGALQVAWSTGETSRYHPGWLRAYCHEARSESSSLPPQRYWNAAAIADVPRFDGLQALNDPAAKTAWLTALHVYGVAVLENLPATPEVIETAPAAIGPIRPTNFGFAFDVVSKADATSNAYTAMTLPLHADLPTREYMPGLQFLHCLKNDAAGGESLLADGFFLAERLRALDPAAFDTMTSIPVDYYNKAKDTDYRHSTPMIRLNADGSFHEVRWTPWLRAPLDAPFETAGVVYRALRLLFSLAEDPANRIEIKLKPGDLLGFDNRRAIHGRKSFDPATGDRHLRGCYVERDELHSRLRILARQSRAAQSGSHG